MNHCQTTLLWVSPFQFLIAPEKVCERDWLHQFKRYGVAFKAQLSWTSLVWAFFRKRPAFLLHANHHPPPCAVLAWRFHFLMTFAFPVLYNIGPWSFHVGSVLLVSFCISLHWSYLAGCESSISLDLTNLKLNALSWLWSTHTWPAPGHAVWYKMCLNYASYSLYVSLMEFLQVHQLRSKFCRHIELRVRWLVG